VTSVPTTVFRPTVRRRRVGVAATSLVAVSTFGLLAGLTGTAQAAATSPGLGTARSFAVLAGSGITNTGTTTINGDIGTYPTPSITGPGTIVQTGVNHADDPVTQGAKADLLNAYGVAAGETPPAAVTADLAGQTLTAGVYKAPSSMGLTGALTLDAAGDPDAVFVFQADTTLITGPGSSVVLLNGAQACNVYWQVGSSATLDTTTVFRGNVLAHDSITLNNGATVEGRVLASGGAVTMDTNTITVPSCTTPVDHSAADAAAASASAAAASAASAAASASGSAVPTGRPTYGQVRRVPVGAVDTGDGSMAEELRRSSAR
jgi:hypothetical protein